MRTLVKMLSLHPRTIGGDAYAELRRLCPECEVVRPGFAGRTVRFIRMVLPEGDPRVGMALDVLARHGLRPSDRFRERQEREFNLSYDREYDAADLEAAPYLLPRPTVMLGVTLDRTADGRVQLEADYLERPDRHGNDLRAADIGNINGAYPVVSERLRGLLEAAGLRRLRLRPVELVGPGRERFAGRYWELSSDLRLPPLPADGRVVNQDGAPFVEGRDRLRLYVEGRYERAELHYAAGALAGVPAFDLALTHGDFMNTGPKLVVSQGFRAFCVAHRLAMAWIPVRLDPEDAPGGGGAC